MDHELVDDSFTVDELKAECQRRGLVTTKEELIRKLNTARAETAEAEQASAPDRAAAAAEHRPIRHDQLDEGALIDRVFSRGYYEHFTPVKRVKADPRQSLTTVYRLRSALHFSWLYHSSRASSRPRTPAPTLKSLSASLAFLNHLRRPIT